MSFLNFIFNKHPLIELLNEIKAGNNDIFEFYDLYYQYDDLSSLIDNNYNTLLHYLANYNVEESELIIIHVFENTKFIDVDAINKDGKTAYDVAFSNKNNNKTILTIFFDYTSSEWYNIWEDEYEVVRFPIFEDITCDLKLPKYDVMRSKHYDVTGNIMKFYDQEISDENWKRLNDKYNDIPYIQNLQYKKSINRKVTYKELIGESHFYEGLNRNDKDSVYNVLLG